MYHRFKEKDESDNEIREQSDKEIDQNLDVIIYKKKQNQLKAQIFVTKKAIEELKQQIKNIQCINFNDSQQDVNKTKNLGYSFKANYSVSRNITSNNLIHNDYKFKDLLIDKISTRKTGFLQEDIHILNEVVDKVNRTSNINKKAIYNEIVNTGIKESELLIDKLKNHPKEILEYHPKYNENIKMKKKGKFNFIEKNSKIYDFYNRFKYIPSVLPINYNSLATSKISQKLLMTNKSFRLMNKPKDGPLDIKNILFDE